MSEPVLDGDSRIELHTLVVRREDEQVIVGRAETAQFVALPEIGGRALESIERSASIADAEAVLDAPFDLVDFAGALVELGFVRAIDGQVIDEGEPFESSLPWLRPDHCRWAFSVPVRLALLALIVFAAVTLALDPALIPRSEDFFWSTHTSVVLAVNTAMFLAALALHELAHLAAARSLGVGGRLSLGTRLHLLVAQTEMTGLWAVPRRRRHRAYVAGMACDLGILSVATLAAAHLALPRLLSDLLGALWSSCSAS